MMKNWILGFVVLILGFTTIVVSCGQTSQQETATTTTTYFVTSTTQAVSMQNLFNVAGAKAVATAQQQGSGGGSLRAKTTGSQDLLKMDKDGKLSSIINSSLGWAPQVTVIEAGPDGSLYVGFQYSLYLPDGSRAAFFKIKPDGSAEVVDASVEAMGAWDYYGYYDSTNYAELPVKQVQFDSAGNVYYLAAQGGYSGAKVLKKKDLNGNISTIGNPTHMYMRDFLVCPNGWVLFHGSDTGSNYYNTTEWLRIINSSNATKNLFYNSSSWSSSHLRSYYFDNNNNIILVGQGLKFEDADGVYYKQASGVVRALLDSSGQPTTVNVVYDDDNMYNSDTAVMGTTLGQRLTYGYWDNSAMTNKRFFTSGSIAAYNPTAGLYGPLTLEAGVSEEAIRNHIKSTYFVVTSETLSSLSFEGITVLSTGETVYGTSVNTLAGKLDALIAHHIQGITWAAWRSALGLSVPFSNAKQIIYLNDGSVYAVMTLGSFSYSGITTDEVFRIINSSGSAELVAYPSHASYRTIKKARAYSSGTANYILYLATSTGSKHKILRLNVADPTAAPVDITEGQNVQIYSFSINSATGKVIYDVYDYNNNNSYLMEKDIVTAAAATQSEATTYQLTDVVPFESTATTTTTTTTVTGTSSTTAASSSTSTSGGTTSTSISTTTGTTR